MSEISKEEYQATQMQVMTLAALVRDLPLEAFLDAISHCETTASFFNPTLYRAGQPKLELIKRVAVAARKFQAALPTREECEAAERESAAWLRLGGVER